MEPLKFLSRNMANTLIFLAEKKSGYFCSKNNSVFENTLTTTVNEFVIDKLVKLTTL